jgi:LPS export ABC transporter protein LptC
MKKILILFLFPLLIPACDQQEQRQPTERTSVTDQQVPDQEGWNSVLRATHKGQLEAVVRYGHMKRYTGKKRVLFDQGIEVDFYQASGEHASRLTAEAGELNENNNNVIAMGTVVVRSDTGITLYTEKITFDPSENLIRSDHDVMVTTLDGDTLYGEGLVSDPRLHHIDLIRPRGRAHKGVDIETAIEPAATPEPTDVPPDAISEPDTLRREGDE